MQALAGVAPPAFLLAWAFVSLFIFREHRPRQVLFETGRSYQVGAPFAIPLLACAGWDFLIASTAPAFMPVACPISEASAPCVSDASFPSDDYLIS